VVVTVYDHLDSDGELFEGGEGVPVVVPMFKIDQNDSAAIWS